MKHRGIWSMLCLAAVGAAVAPAWATEPYYDWHGLAGVKRLVVLPPRFCVPIPVDDLKLEYHALAETMTQVMPKRLAVTGRFVIISGPQVDRALKSLHWKPESLYSKRGEEDWPQLDAGRMAKLAKALHADALFVGWMRDPVSVGDGVQFHHEKWNVNPLNWSLQRIRSHVLSPRVRAEVVTAFGQIVWHDEQMADHPRSVPKTRKTLRIDWQEATLQAAQELADSLNRLPPVSLDGK